MPESNESLVCDWVIDVICQRLGQEADQVFKPDDVVHDEPAVDREFRVGSHLYCLEHTRIESFEGQIGVERVYLENRTYIQSELEAYSFGQGLFRLLLPASLLSSRRAITEHLPEVRRWLQERAPLLEIGSPSTAPRHVAQENLDGIGLVRLERWPAEGSKMRLGLLFDEDEESRRRRVVRALEDKCPKLESARTAGGVTALVLESDDLQLANQVLIRKALLDACRCVSVPLPDELYLAETDLWQLWTLRLSRKFLEAEKIGPTYYVAKG